MLTFSLKFSVKRTSKLRRQIKSVLDTPPITLKRTNFWTAYAQLHRAESRKRSCVSMDCESNAERREDGVYMVFCHGHRKHPSRHYCIMWKHCHPCRPSETVHSPFTVQTVLFRSLATSDVCVGLISQPMFAASLLLIGYGRRWDVCLLLRYSTYLVSTTLCGVSLLTLTTISVDRLLVP